MTLEKDIPKIGDTRKAREIGKAGTNKYIWLGCNNCGYTRWVMSGFHNNKCIKCCNKGKNHAYESGQNSVNWKGGKHKSKHGYIWVRITPDSFFYNGRRYILEHRLIMSEHLHRKLLPWEIVHHKNGVKNDNRLENLQLLGCRGKHNTQIARNLKGQFKKIELLRNKLIEINNENIYLKELIRSK
jgi:hypothetical protein